MRNLLEKADSEKRSLTDEEGTQFDELRIRAGTLDTEISRYEAIASEERNQPGHPVNENGVSNDELRTYILTGKPAACLPAFRRTVAIPLFLNLTNRLCSSLTMSPLCAKSAP